MMKCPACGVNIPVTMYDLLNNGVIECPTCGLHLEIDNVTSAKAIEALRKLAEKEKEQKQA